MDDPILNLPDSLRGNIVMPAYLPQVQGPLRRIHAVVHLHDSDFTVGEVDESSAVVLNASLLAGFVSEKYAESD